MPSEKTTAKSITQLQKTLMEIDWARAAQDARERSRERIMAGEAMSGPELERITGDPSVPNLPRSSAAIEEEIERCRYRLNVRLERGVRLDDPTILAMWGKIQALEQDRLTARYREVEEERRREEMARLSRSRSVMLRPGSVIRDPGEPELVYWFSQKSPVQVPPPKPKPKNTAPAYDPANPPSRKYDI